MDNVYYSSTRGLVALQLAKARGDAAIRFAVNYSSCLSSHEELNIALQSAGSEITISSSTWNMATDLIERSLNLGIESIGFLDSRYPKCLRIIPDPPPVLYVRGNIKLCQKVPGVALVGTRNASEAGLKIATRLGRYLSDAGWIVVSGLAIGIDQAAHKGALQGSCQTIAVLANGLHKASPKVNEKLAMCILDKGGAWVSEHPIGTTPRKHFFVPRNRIQVGLAAASIIVEAGLSSGSTSQARFCLSQGKPLFAVVPEITENPLSLNVEGTVDLVARGKAIPIKSRVDYENLLKTIENSKNRIIQQSELKESVDVSDPI